MKISPNSRVNRSFTGRPAWEMSLNHYLMRMNIPEDSIKWLKRARDKAIEKTDSGLKNIPWNFGAGELRLLSLKCRRPEYENIYSGNQ